MYNAVFRKTMENVRYIILHKKILCMYSLQFFYVQENNSNTDI